MSNKLRIGIVGCGGVVRDRHIPAFMKLKRNTVLQAVCDKDESLARDMANKYHIPSTYTDLSQMLLKENLDIVDICTPPQVHTPLAVEALEHGCHVLMEKPMALKVSDCDKMIDVARKQELKLGIIHHALFHPPFLKARDLVAKGAIGEFIGSRVLLSNHRDDMLSAKDFWIHKLPGGLIGENGVHAIYIALAFLNKVKTVDVYAKSFLEHPWAPFDEFRIELEGEKAVSSIVMSYASNRNNLDVEILGTDGVLHLDLHSLLLIHHREKGVMKPAALAGYSLSTVFQITGGIAANAVKAVTRRIKLGHDINIEGFVSSILNNQPPPVTGEDGRETTRVMEMVVEKLRNKYGIP